MATTTRKFGTDISNIQRNFQPKKILSKGGDNTSVNASTKIPIHEDTPQVSNVLETVLPTPSLIPFNESKDQVLNSEKIGSDSSSPVVYSREFLMAFQKFCNEPIEGLIPEVLPGYVDPNKVEEDESQAFSPKFSPTESPFHRTVRARSRHSSPLAFTPHNAKSVPAVSNDEQVPSFAREMEVSVQETSPTTTPVTKRAKQTRTPAGEKSNADMALTPNALKAEWKKKKEKPKESDPKRLRARQKQIDIGMNTVGYTRYLELVAPENRTLRIPDIHQVCSKRSWDGQVRKWRRELHKYDPPGSQTNDADDIMSESDGEYDSEDSSDSCSSVIITLNSPSTVK